MSKTNEEVKEKIEALNRAANIGQGGGKRGFIKFILLIFSFILFAVIGALLEDGGKEKKLGDTFEFYCTNGSHRVPYAVDILPGDSIEDLTTYGIERCAKESNMWNRLKGTKGVYYFSRK